MSLIKSLLLAIVITLFLTYAFGISIMHFLDVDIYVDNQVVEPIKALSVSALVAVVMVLVAAAIIVSVFGTIIFIAMLIFGSLAMLAIGVFWPILLIALVLWLVTRDKKAQIHSP